MLLIRRVSLGKRKTQCSLQMIKLQVKKTVTCTVQTSMSRVSDNYIELSTEIYAPNFLSFVYNFLSFFRSDKLTEFILIG